MTTLAYCERGHALVTEGEEVLGTAHVNLSLQGMRIEARHGVYRTGTAMQPRRLDAIDPGGTTLLSCGRCRRHYLLEHDALLDVIERHAHKLRLGPAAVT